MWRALLLGLAALACLATSPPRQLRRYPEWQLVGERVMQAGCSRLEIWASRSGKQGLGLSLDLAGAAAGERCLVGVASARLLIGGQRVAGQLPEPVQVDDGKGGRLYVPFVFDGNAMWNRGIEQATLELTMTVDGAPQPARRIELRTFWPSPHLDYQDWNSQHEKPEPGRPE